MQILRVGQQVEHRVCRLLARSTGKPLLVNRCRELSSLSLVSRDNLRIVSPGCERVLLVGMLEVGERLQELVVADRTDSILQLQWEVARMSSGSVVRMEIERLAVAAELSEVRELEDQRNNFVDLEGQ